jgi:pimeloyl-ACP methyl ester carboxylesterase
MENLDNLTHDFVETNGIKLHVTQAGPADGEPVILLHGFPELWYGWRKQIPYLVERGFRVWAPDMRGYNLSDKPAGIANYAIANMVADVVGLINQMGHEKINLVGHDWGATVSWSTAIAHPNRIKKLVILNVPHHEVFLKYIRTSPRQMLRSWYMGMFQLPRLPEAMMLRNGGQAGIEILRSTARPGTFTDEDATRYIQAWQQPGAMTAMLNYYRALMQVRMELPADSRVHVPAMVIWGAKDHALGREMAQPSVDLCDDGRLEFIEEASHWVQHEEPERVNELIGEFLGDTPN